MSLETQVERISQKLKELYKDKIDMSDTRQGDDAHFLSRALAAYIVKDITGATIEQSADSVTDSGGDQGIDGVFLDISRKCLYLIQSKYIKKGARGPEKTDVLNFIAGTEMLLNGDFEKFSEKVRKKQPEVEVLTKGTDYSLALIFVTTGSKIAPNSEEPIKSFLDRQNSLYSTAWVTFEEYSLEDCIEKISRDREHKQIDFEIGLEHWGMIKGPLKAYYGTVSVSSIAEWWKNYGPFLFKRNLRNPLGQSADVNRKISQTLHENPDYFFYYNNGITILADEVDKTKMFGDKREVGTFECKGVQIINGAQTVGCIGRANVEIDGATSLAQVLVRIISLKGGSSEIASRITIAANSQNHIEMLDFASMDAQQIRLERELNLQHGARYKRMRGEADQPREEDQFGMEEAAIALSCFESDVAVSTILKRERNRIWEDLVSPPYTSIFNDELTPSRVINCTNFFRVAEAYLSEQRKLTKGRERTFLQSGDRFLIHLAMNIVSEKHAKFSKEPIDFKAGFTNQTIIEKVEIARNAAWHLLNSELYLGAQIARLFITNSRLILLKTACLGIIQPQQHDLTL